MKKIDPRVILFIGVMVTSTSPVVVKNVAAPSLAVAAWRLAWTMVIMLPVAFYRRADFKQVSRRDLVTAMAAGTLFALHLICWFGSLKHSSVATASVLCCTEVIFAALGFALVLKGRIPPLGVAAIAVAFGGSLILALSKSGGADTLFGNVLGLLAGFLIAGYSLIGRVERGHLTTTVYTFLTYGSCFVVLLLGCWISGTPLLSYDLGELAASSLFLTITCTFFGHTVFTWCLKWLSPSYVSAVKLCAPGFSAVFAFFLLRENLAPLQIVGGLVTLLGAFLYTRAEEMEGKKEKKDCNLPQAEV